MKTKGGSYLKLATLERSEEKFPPNQNTITNITGTGGISETQRGNPKSGRFTEKPQGTHSPEGSEDTGGGHGGQERLGSKESFRSALRLK